MTLNRSTPHLRTTWFGRLGRLGRAGLTATVGMAGISAGCLDRPIGEPQPETSNVFVKQTPTGQVDKIDILFAIDNSLSMGDKQQVLAAAVPQLLTRLTNPDCVNPDDPTAAPVPAQGPNVSCETQVGPGFSKEFAPVNNIHLAVITSSMGDNGGNYCPDPTPDTPENIAQNDHAWLIGALDASRTGLPNDVADFLAWGPSDAANWQTAIQTRTNEFRSLVTAAGELGCGLEMTLESWYRFLIDPMPPVAVDLRIPGETSSNTIRSSVADPVNGVDQAILAQRAAFLRPDSLLAIVMLSDENDCSLKDSGIGFLPGTITAMRRGTSTCDSDPNAACCYSCYFDNEQNRPPGCSADAACQVNSGIMDANTDYSGLRCYDQKRRFGYDFLMPLQRYVNALTKTQLCLDNDELACASEAEDPARYAAQEAVRYPNPIYTIRPDAVITGIERTNSDLVFIAGIVGVPWQNIATDASLEPTATLQYQLANQIDWDLILPEYQNPNDVANDPHMQETPNVRSGSNPRTGDAIAPPDSVQRDVDRISMHDWNAIGDLQYACTFDLSQPLAEGQTTAAKDCLIDCATQTAEPAAVCERRLASCSCTTKDQPETSLNPLCQDPGSGAYGNTQYAAKAYPSLRQLEVLRQFHLQAVAPQVTNNAIVASICPKNLDFTQNASAGYGYNPAVKALVDRLKEKLGGTCLPRALTVQDDGTLPCAVIEVVRPSSDYCACEAHGRTSVGADMSESVRGALENAALCDVEGRDACRDMCLCELPQLAGGARDQCLSQANIEKSAEQAGYCYVDPSQSFGSEDVVAGCPTSQKRMLRIVGNSTNPAPAPGSWIFIACVGAPQKEDPVEAAPEGE